MSELPGELRDLVAETRRAHEPESSRLAAVRARLNLRAGADAEFDVAPPKLRAGRWWLWSGLAAVVAVMGAWLSPEQPTATVPARDPGAPTAPADATAAPLVASAPEGSRAAAPPKELPGDAAPESVPAPLPRAQKPRPSNEPPRRAVPVPGVHAPEQENARLRAEQTVQAAAAAPAVDDPLGAAPRAAAPAGEEDVEAPAAAPDAGELAGRWEATSLRARPARAPTRASLQDEVKLVTRARKQLAAGDWTGAERALHEHRSEYPAGQLQAERVALLARCRCMAGDLAGARSLHAELTLLAAQSSLVRNVERACPQLGR